MNQTDQRFIRQTEIAALTPTTMDAVKAGADQLKAGNPLIINLGNLSSEEKLWAIHFLNGVTYALDGRIMEISPKVFLYAPRNVVVSKD